MQTEFEQEQKAARALGHTFRGDIYEAFPTVPMGKGYSNDGKPFNIEEACYLKPVFKALTNPTVRKIVIKAGVQSLKTYLTELTAAYKIVHDPGEMAIYDCDIDAARDHSKSRLAPYLKSMPGIAEQIEEIENRHDITTKEFYLPGMTLRMWPLNISSTQRITLRYVFIHDAFLSKNSGMIEQAIARTTQHPNDKLIIIESQGSDEGDDFDRQYESTNQQELHVKCPYCHEGQPFEFDRRRDDGSMSGFKKGADEKILLKNGKWDEAAIIRETYYECFACRTQWPDLPHIRKTIDESSYYVAKNPTANPENVGFNWPNWVNRRIVWGGDSVMLGYLIAKRADKEFGLKDPLKQWYQKRAARTWSDRLSQANIPVQIGNYDPNKVIENEHHNGLVIDCQKHPTIDSVGTFWYEVYAADTLGNSFQLDRGFITPTPEKDGWKQLDEIQERWKIPNDYVCIDGAKWTPEILKRVAERRKLVTGSHYGRVINYWSTWRVLMGDGIQRSFPWMEGNQKVFKVWSPPKPNPEIIINDKGERERILVHIWRWSNLSVKDQLYNIRLGGEGKPKFEALAYAQLSPANQMKETGDLSYETQMSAEMRTETGKRPVWEKIRPNNHYWDLACMRLTRIGMAGLAGHIVNALE